MATTDNRPLITYAGEISVFQSVAPLLQKGIGAEAVEWKRAYGRTTKHVNLHPRFIPFDPDSMCSSSQPNGEENPKEAATLTSLLDQPMLHTYWTDCPDVEIYRSTCKDGIQSWLNHVKACNIREWLIVLVEMPDNKRSKQLLPRSSVIDRVKNDFAQKQTERCICLNDPHKLDSKSAESLHGMLHRLRQLLLASYSKTLTKFEENMRAQREKRNEAGWNFCHYFLLQEELAFVLEMLEVYDEALVQYDELDALFTQFVLNSHLTDTPQWLLSFQRYGDRWPALSLSSHSGGILSRIRESINNSTVSLLNFRNYLFARQAALLLKQKHFNELAQRSLGFLHNCINELSILDVTFTEEGSLSCWIFASCLEILDVVCGHGEDALVNNSVTVNGDAINNKGNKTEAKTGPADISTIGSATFPSDFSVHTASLRDYAREKLYELGKLAGLLPKSQLKSDHLHKVISLAAGLTPPSNSISTNGNSEENRTKHNIISTDCATISPPIEKLKNALSSKEQFEQHYLELCELTMGTYKHIGRLRSSRRVGLSLANYYIEAQEFQKAIGFLADALMSFRADKWDLLVVEVLLKLAQCYQEVKDTEKYIRTCAQLACSKALSEEQRSGFFDEMMTCLEAADNPSPVLAPTDDTFIINSIMIETPGKINLDLCPVEVKIDFESNLPKPVLSSSVEVAILICDNNHEKHMQNLYQNTTNSPVNDFGLSQQGPGSKGSGTSSGNRLIKKSSLTVNPNLNTKRDLNETKSAIERTDSNNPVITCEDEDANLNMSEMNLSNVRLQLGQHFDTKQDKSVHGGRLMCHNPHQALRRKESLVKRDFQVLKTDFSLAAKSHDIMIQPGANSITLHAEVLQPGIFRLGQVSVNIKHFELVSPRMGCRYKFNVDKIPGSIELSSGDSNMNLIAGIEQVVTFTLQTGSNQIDFGAVLNIRSTSHELQLKLFENSPLCSEVSVPLPATNPFGSISVQVRMKAELGPQKNNAVIQHKVIAKCPWPSEEAKLPVIFLPPLMSTYKLHSVGSRKFLQVILHGLTDSSFLVSNHHLEFQGQLSQDIPLVPLNPRSQELVLSTGQTASYMWEIGVVTLDDEALVRLEFSVMFCPGGKSTHPELYKFYICLQHFKTQFEIRSRIEPHKGTEFCRVGNMSSMIIEIIRTSATIDSNIQVMYEVRADQHVWAICGRSSGTLHEAVNSWRKEAPFVPPRVNYNFEKIVMLLFHFVSTGVISMEDNEVQIVTLDVMPMSPGFLHLPTVHLSKYIPAVKGGSSTVPFDPFHLGQVFNRCKGMQMHVLPPPQAPSSNLSIGSSGSGSGMPVISDSHF